MLIVMAKEDFIDVEGIVVEVLPNSRFIVDGGNYRINAYPSGKLRLNFIRIMLGDKVTVRVSPNDFTKGRIVWRHN